MHKGKTGICALSTDNHNILGYEQDNWQKTDVTDRSGDTGNFCRRLHIWAAPADVVMVLEHVHQSAVRLGSICTARMELDAVLLGVKTAALLA